jgi:RNA recognition motif-containing protein
MNLPYSVGWQDLKDLFRNAGNIVRAEVGSLPDGRSKGNGTILFETVADAQRAITQFQGYNWQGRVIELKEDKFARDAAGGGGRMRSGSYERGGRGSFSGGQSGGYDAGYTSSAAPPARSVESNPFTDHAWGNGEPSETIFVKNLPWSTSDEDLVELFVTIGPVARAEICYEPNGRSKGMGVVQFDEAEHAETAIQRFSGYQYGGRPLNLSYVRYESGVPTGPSADVGGASQQDLPAVPAPVDVVMN